MKAVAQLSDFERVALLSKLPRAGAGDFSATMVRVVSREETGVGFYTALEQLPGCDLRFMARLEDPPTGFVRHASLRTTES